jgi:hypothetical protein
MKPSVYYSRAMFDALCERLASGEALSVICRSDPAMPTTWGVHKMLERNEDGCADRYREAQACRVEKLVDEAMEIADETGDDIVIGPKGGKKINREAIQRSDLRVRTRLWMAEKLLRTKYGQHQTVDVGKMTLEALVLESMKPKPADGGTLVDGKVQNRLISVDGG